MQKMYNVTNHCLASIVLQGCGIAMPDSSDSYIAPAGQVDFPG